MWPCPGGIGVLPSLGIGACARAATRPAAEMRVMTEVNFMLVNVVKSDYVVG